MNSHRSTGPLMMAIATLCASCLLLSVDGAAAKPQPKDTPTAAIRYTVHIDVSGENAILNDHIRSVLRRHFESFHDVDIVDSNEGTGINIVATPINLEGKGPSAYAMS